MEKLLEKYSVEGIQSYMVLPPRNEMMEGELKQRIKESSLDSVLVVRPKAVRTETEEVVTGGIYMPPSWILHVLALLEHGLWRPLSRQFVYEGKRHGARGVQSLQHKR